MCASKSIDLGGQMQMKPDDEHAILFGFGCRVSWAACGEAQGREVECVHEHGRGGGGGDTVRRAATGKSASSAGGRHTHDTAPRALLSARGAPDSRAARPLFPPRWRPAPRRALGGLAQAQCAATVGSAPVRLLTLWCCGSQRRRALLDFVPATSMCARATSARQVVELEGATS